jgi:hypothetical protein
MPDIFTMAKRAPVLSILRSGLLRRTGVAALLRRVERPLKRGVRIAEFGLRTQASLEATPRQQGHGTGAGQGRTGLLEIR